MRKRAFYIVLAALTLWGMLFVSSSSAFANRTLEERIQNIQQERYLTEQKAKESKNELEKIRNERKQMEEEMAAIDQEMVRTNKEIEAKEKEVSEAKARIDQLKEEIKILEERIKERDQLLKERARSMYQTGGTIRYLEVLLGAKSFGDFIDRLNALTVIVEQDKNILKSHIEDQQKLEEAKREVEKELQKLEQSLAQLEQLKAQLEKQKKEKDRIIQSLFHEEEDIHDLLDRLQNEAEILAQQERAMKQELEAIKRAQRQTGGQAPQVISGNGKLLRPAAGTITSHFGSRVHPIYKTTRMHRGIDIANRTGTPVYAAETGTVITASYDSGYGNYVMITHNIDGQVITTLYAHLNSIHVSAGQRVSRGQQIGTMGSTGASTGPHLHFEVHLGPWNGNQNAVNPLNYLQ